MEMACFDYITFVSGDYLKFSLDKYAVLHPDHDRDHAVDISGAPADLGLVGPRINPQEEEEEHDHGDSDVFYQKESMTMGATYFSCRNSRTS